VLPYRAPVEPAAAEEQAEEPAAVEAVSTEPEAAAATEPEPEVAPATEPEPEEVAPAPAAEEVTRDGEVEADAGP
jgi:hypothetical protein